jgi:hypothetical protein
VSGRTGARTHTNARGKVGEQAARLRGPDGRWRQNLSTGHRVAGHVAVYGRAQRVRGIVEEETDRYGLLTKDPKYRMLGPRGKQNVAVALREGIKHTASAGTVEEMVCYGELRRRGYERSPLPRPAGPRDFVWQAWLDGYSLDFLVAQHGRLLVIQPQNVKWHGGGDARANEDKREQLLMAREVDEVWSLWTPMLIGDESVRLLFDEALGEVG